MGVPAIGNVPSSTVVMTIQLPTRSKPAAKCGPSLDLSPQQVREIVDHPSGHGLTACLKDHPAWESFAWKGTDLSAWMRTLFIAELHGLLTRRPDGSSQPVQVTTIVNSTNQYLAQLGRPPVTETAILANLRTAATNVSVAFGLKIIPDVRTMTVRLMDGHECAVTIEEVYSKLEKKARYLADVLENAERLGHDMRGTLAATPEFQRLSAQVQKVLAPAA